MLVPDFFFFFWTLIDLDLSQLLECVSKPAIISEDTLCWPCLVLVLLVFLHVLCKINFNNILSYTTVQRLLIFISVSLPPHKVFTQFLSSCPKRCSKLSSWRKIVTVKEKEWSWTRPTVLQLIITFYHVNFNFISVSLYCIAPRLSLLILSLILLFFFSLILLLCKLNRKQWLSMFPEFLSKSY